MLGDGLLCPLDDRSGPFGVVEQPEGGFFVVGAPLYRPDSAFQAVPALLRTPAFPQRRAARLLRLRQQPDVGEGQVVRVHADGVACLKLKKERLDPCVRFPAQDREPDHILDFFELQ